jgi:ABC-2 type transport system permease protein
MTTVTARPRVTTGRPDELAGTSILAGLALRRDRIVLPIWLYALAASLASTAYSFRHLYTTPAARRALAASVQGDPSILALSGPLYGDSSGSLVAWKILVFAAAGAALMGIFTMIRHTRADEEAGRLELVGATAVGRQAALAASLVVSFGSCLALVPLIAAVGAVFGYPAAGSLAMGLAVGLAGCVFAAVAAAWAQLTTSARTARGMAGGVLGVAFLLRAVGDSASGLSWLTWASPLGWAERMQAYGGDRWAVAGLPVAAAAVATGCAAVLAARRDLGGGLLPDRPGPAQAPGWLRGPLTLAWRLHRGALLGWAVGVALAAAVLGSAARGIGAVLNISPQARQEIIRLGGHSGLVNAYIAAMLQIMGVAAAAYAMAAALRLRSEESEHLADPVLATPTGRVRWAGSHLLVGAAGTAVLLAVAGVGMALGDGLTSGGLAAQLPRLTGAALAQVPAAWLMAGLAAALFGLAPRVSVPAAWTAFGLVALLTLLGPAIKLPQWVLDVSPFTHVPKLPGVPFTITPLAWLLVVAVALTVAGLAGFRRRDLT